ncbi:FAD dependent oxidoreductase [Cetobacterium ceti]|uniref:FAD dependent oxidoreductase n=1 Tax=Cetobacterium ceti TaxID=180163 RepID=A0A1T4N0G4_9FUSO|nr:FAD-dependent oxidoreductase [Cetobacterium ceti]SJZ72722.1 FAD dependent oxidoreductase [Cetobacterium ceti]
MIYDVLIIGAGIIGKMVAHELSKYKLSVAVVDKKKEEDLNGNESLSKSIIHGNYTTSQELFTDRFSYNSRVIFENISKYVDFQYNPIGSFLIGKNPKENEKILKIYETAQKSYHKDIKLLEKKEIFSLQEELKDQNVQSGIYCTGTGTCSPILLSNYLLQSSKSNGIHYFFNSKVLSIEKYSDFYEVSTTNSQYKDFLCKIIINCSGYQGNTISEMVSDPYYNINYSEHKFIAMEPLKTTSTNSIILEIPSSIEKRFYISSANDKLRLFTGRDNLVVKKSIAETFINVGDTSVFGLTYSPIIASRILNLLEETNLNFIKKDL